MRRRGQSVSTTSSHETDVVGRPPLGSGPQPRLGDAPEVQPPADLSRGGTSTAALLLQIDGQVGVVAPGAFADLLVIDGDPLEDIRVLTTPDKTLRLIMKEGQIYKNQL